ncbi:unnamed protein product [Mortierella alpina]
MSQIFLRRLRIGIAALSFITGCLLAAYYGELIRTFGSRSSSLIIFRTWIPYARVVCLVCIFGSYVYSVKRPTKVHRYLRAFLLLGMATTLLYINLVDIHVIILMGTPYACPTDDHACGLFRAVEFITILFGFLIILEVGVTLKHGPLEPRSAPKDVEIVSPLQPIQPQPYYQQQPYAYYPPQQSGQPLPLQQHVSSMKYEAQGPVVMQQYQQPHQPYFQPQHMPPPPQQQQYYHLQHQQLQQQQPQQQQPHPYSNANYSTPPPQVPGSMVTTTPQSGVQPMATPTSPGFSIAVSPVMPSEGYSTPLVGHSPVQPAP